MAPGSRSRKCRTTRAVHSAALVDFQGRVDTACPAAAIDKEASDDLKLAVDEACTNVIGEGNHLVLTKRQEVGE